jgi:HSP20 family protein
MTGRFHDDLFDRLRDEMGTLFNEWYAPNLRGEEPLMNVGATDEEVLITAEVPGIDPEKLDISIVGDTLTLSGERAAETFGKEAKFLRQERFSGTFLRTLQLPFRVDAEKVEAKYHNGILEMKVPRAVEDRPKKIAVQVS